MDIKRFNERMGKVRKYSKGGMIKKIAGRHYFDDGGSTSITGPTTVGGPANTVNNNGLVGTIGNLLGQNNQFQAGTVPIQQGTNAAQLNQSYQGVQGGLGQQQNFANAALPGAQQGFGTQAALTGQLEGVANGTGPNPAQAALNQNTAQNVANQAALMAGQRGASANAGLIARQAAQQGAATQQEAVGQGATLQAQQQIAAQQQLGTLAQQQVNQGAGAVQGVNNAQQNEQNILQGANTSANNTAVGMQSNLNNVNAGVAAGNQKQAGNILGGVGDMLSNIPVIGSFFDKGGQVGDHHCAGAACTDRAHYAHMMASGGPLQVAPTAPINEVGPWLQSNVAGPAPAVDNAPVANPDSDSEGGGKSGGSGAGLGALATLLYKGGSTTQGPHDSHVANFLASGGEVPAMVSPGERYLNPEEVRKVVEHGENPLKLGRKFGGKAKVKGDSLKNDNIPATLQEGGVVLPRHIMNKKNRDHAELFVRRAVHMKAPKGK